MLGEGEFKRLAWEVWRCLPAERGDLGLYGEGFPDFLADQPLPAALAYLPDVARLDWAVARAWVAADAEPDPESFQALGREDSLAWRARWVPGLALIESAWPIVAVWEAHHGRGSDSEERFAAARESMRLGLGEAAWVWRGGWRAQVAVVPANELSFLRALVAGASLGESLDQGAGGFDLSACLRRGLQEGWWLGMVPPTGIEPVFAA